MLRPVQAATLAIALATAIAAPALAADKAAPWTKLEWSTMDADGDGEIAKKEFKAGLKAQKSSLAPKADAWFAKIDHDKDGKLSESEIGDWLRVQSGQPSRL